MCTILLMINFGTIQTAHFCISYQSNEIVLFVIKIVLANPSYFTSSNPSTYPLIFTLIAFFTSALNIFFIRLGRQGLQELDLLSQSWKDLSLGSPLVRLTCILHADHIRHTFSDFEGQTLSVPTGEQQPCIPQPGLLPGPLIPAALPKRMV